MSWNQETNLVAVHIDNNEQFLYCVLSLCKWYRGKGGFSQGLKEFVEREISDNIDLDNRKPLEAFADDLLWAALARVEWNKLKSHYMDKVKEGE